MRIKLLALLGLALALGGCADSKPNSAQAASPVAHTEGGESSGGGNVRPRKSSLLEVNQAIEFTLGEVRSSCQFKQYDTDWYFQLGTDWYFAKNEKKRKLLQDVSENACDLLKDRVEQNKIIPQESPCIDPLSKELRDSAVSEFTRNGSVCLSTSRLQNNPPSELRTQIRALLLHESVHLLGYRSEDLARYVQTYYLTDLLPMKPFGPPCSTEDKSPRGVRCILGWAHLHQAQLLAERNEQLEKLRAGREFLSAKGISCVDASGKPLGFNALKERLMLPETLAKLGLAPLKGEGELSKNPEFFQIQKRLWVYAIGMYPTAISLPGVPELPNNPKWVEKRKRIVNIYEEAYRKWTAFFGETNPSDSGFTSVCQADEASRRIMLQWQIEKERAARVYNELMFD